MANRVYIENYVPAIKLARGLYTKKPVVLIGSSATLTMDAGIAAAANTAITSGGSTTGVVIGTSGPGIYVGSGAPTISAVQGSLYLRTDGSSTSTRLYVNTNGSTTWTNVTTAA